MDLSAAVYLCRLNALVTGLMCQPCTVHLAAAPHVRLAGPGGLGSTLLSSNVASRAAGEETYAPLSVATC